MSLVFNGPLTIIIKLEDDCLGRILFQNLRKIRFRNTSRRDVPQYRDDVAVFRPTPFWRK